MFEDEFGVFIFECSGKCFIGVIELGKVVLVIVECILCEVENFKWVSVEFVIGDSGWLVLVVIYI